MRPAKIHFITGLRPDFGGMPFNIVHMLAILSARITYPDHEIFVYYEHEPSGIWWDYARRFVTEVPTVAPTAVFGCPVRHFAHAADVLRLQLLIEHGGIYFDTDTMVCRPIADLPTDVVVMGLDAGSEHSAVGLSNAFIAAPPGAPFLRRWFDGYRDFDARDYVGHSVKLPHALAMAGEPGVRIMSRLAFCYPHNDARSLHNLFARSVDVRSSYSIHLWESVSWHYIAAITPEAIARADTTYNLLARAVLTHFPDSPASPKLWPVRIALDRASLPHAAIDRPAFWYVAFHDNDGAEVARLDADAGELARLAAMPGGELVIERAVPALQPPRSWTVWPTDRARRWLDPLRGQFAR